MRISDTEVRKVISGVKAVAEIDPIGTTPTDEDRALVESVTRDVLAMSDREDRIAEVKAMLEAGTYNPSGDEIAESMVRRRIADKVR